MLKTQLQKNRAFCNNLFNRLILFLARSRVAFKYTGIKYLGVNMISLYRFLASVGFAAVVVPANAQNVEVEGIFNAAISSCKKEVDVFEENSGEHYNRSGRYIEGSESRYDILGSAAQKPILRAEDLRELVSHAGGKAKMLTSALESGRKFLDRDLMLVRLCMASSVERSASSYLTSNPSKITAQSPSSPGGFAQDQNGQQDVNQSIALAQQNQAQGDEQARKKGRREHRPDLDAKECLQFNPNTRLLRNACSYKIEVTYCAIDPMPQNYNTFDVTWAFDCNNRQRFGASTLGAGKDLIGMFPHRTGGGISIAACKEEFPKDVKFSGNQIEYRCRPI